MLSSLHVKNLALIEEEEITFGEGLNILTGETGAGKSILLGALSLALGGKVNKDMVRDDAQDALVEATFLIGDEPTREALRALDITLYDDELILTRRITGGRAQAKVNGEAYPAAKLAELKGVLLDIYGQREHQSLLKKAKHLELLDTYAKDALKDKKDRLAEAYRTYAACNREWEDAVLSGEDRTKELLFLRHEADEIDAASLKDGEDVALEEEYRKLSNSNRIMEALSEVYRSTGADGAAGEQIGRALKSLTSVSEYDAALSDMEGVLSDVDALLSDFNREVSCYMTDAAFDGERFAAVEGRLNTINALKDKYGSTIADILDALEDRRNRIEQLEDYDKYLSDVKKRRDAAYEVLSHISDEVSAIRKKAADTLCDEVKEVLLELNFLDVRFKMSFERAKDFRADGYDDTQFMISLNPGESLRALTEVASGGELSRIMLAIKTVLAKGDATDTLIFDEIDAGISGRAAQAVSEKLSLVAREHQVICITHLPQIASMADRHFLIEKHIAGDRTVSAIHPLSDAAAEEELARLLGGATITDAVRTNAGELIAQAKAWKRNTP